MLIVKIEYQIGFVTDYSNPLDVILQPALDIAVYAVLPLFISTIHYVIGMIGIFCAIVKEHTDFSKLACIFTVKILLNIVAGVAPNKNFSTAFAW